MCFLQHHSEIVSISLVLQVIGIHVDRVCSINELYEIRPGLVVHLVDVNLTFVVRFVVSVERQNVVDLITHIHIPLGLDILIEFRGSVVADVHIQVNLLKVAQSVASPNNSPLGSNEGLIICL